MFVIPLIGVDPFIVGAGAGVDMFLVPLVSVHVGIGPFIVLPDGISAGAGAGVGPFIVILDGVSAGAGVGMFVVPLVRIHVGIGPFVSCLMAPVLALACSLFHSLVFTLALACSLSYSMVSVLVLVLVLHVRCPTRRCSRWHWPVRCPA